MRSGSPPPDYRRIDDSDREKGVIPVINTMMKMME